MSGTHAPFGRRTWRPTRDTQRRADAGNGSARRELYHYGARAYLPAVGVFTQPDNVVPDYGDPRSLNRYAYTLNNPVKYTDPTGHESEDWIDDSWKQEFRDTNGREPDAGDYVYRVAMMAVASGLTGTFGLGLSATGFAGVGVRGDVSFVVDTSGNIGLLVSGGGGGFSAAGAATTRLQSAVGSSFPRSTPPTTPSSWVTSVDISGKQQYWGACICQDTPQERSTRPSPTER